ncbi:scavenger receptor cysteine-rich domain superfamily protein-like isoform X2 [Halichondria panicea]|uniref:scavenger receptor cysteine-rich domain superfamily protein-like isoform X2 n=1 Tax=Halichondria panicea TaxID=6063 RepID=UPI00312B7D17
MMIQLITVSLLLLGTQVSTQACFHGDVQLVNDNNVNNIVEFCYKGEWRRICVSAGWGNVEANIVCSQLGYSNQGATTSNVSISENSPYTFLRFVDCDESDANIDECYYEARNGCKNVDKHATVQCSSANCTDSDIRFVGGATDNEGKVEICNDSRWIAICSNGWTEQDAGQMCQKFGFASIGAEVLVFNPRRVPTINCTISNSGDLSCNESCDDGTTDLGIRCVRQEVLDQEISVESSCGAESSTTALGVLVGLLVTLLVVLLIVCGAMWNRISQKDKQIYVIHAAVSRQNQTHSQQFNDNSTTQYTIQAWNHTMHTALVDPPTNKLPMAINKTTPTQYWNAIRIQIVTQISSVL